LPVDFSADETSTFVLNEPLLCPPFWHQILLPLRAVRMVP
jgi:hypothetical protein